VVTFCIALSEDGDQYASGPEIAEALARLHRLVAPAELGIPPLAANAAQRIAADTWLNPKLPPVGAVILF
jgi:hypothetical protein